MKGFFKSKNVSRLLFLILAIFSVFGFISVNGIRGAHADLTSSSSNRVSTNASLQATLYVSSWFGHSTYALNASNGSTTWSSQNGGSHADEALTLSDGIIYCGSSDGFIYAIKSSDGSLLWKYQTNGINSPPTVSNGTVYIGSWDGNMYALDAVTGKEQWQFHTGGQIHSLPAVVNSVVYFGSGDGNEYAVKTNGSLLWKYQTGGGVYAPSAVVNGVVYIGSGSDLVYALRTNDGSRLWSYSTGAPAYSGATVVSGTVYIDSGKYLYELGADTGNLIRLIQVGQQGGAQPAVVNGVIYVGSVDSNIYAIRASDGTLLWQYTTQGFMGAKPVIVNNTIYMGGSSGLYALTLNGKLIWVFNSAGAVTAPVVSKPPTQLYDPGNYAGKSGFVSTGSYNEPNNIKHVNYCGPGASQVLISAWTSNVPDIETLATQEKTNQGKVGTYMQDMVGPINSAIGQNYYSIHYASSQGDFSNMIGQDILDNHHPLITGLLTIYGKNHLNGWKKVVATHIITIYGFDFISPSVGYIYYYETAGTMAGATEGPGQKIIDYNVFWSLVQQNNIQLS